MASTEQGRRPRRSFTEEYKAGVVDLCRSGGRSMAEVARDLDLTESSVRRWVSQAEIDAGRREGLTTDEREELVRLRRENRVLREERDILRRANGFFRQGDPVNVYPFIEAEKVTPAGNVRKACLLLGVSRAAYYAWSAGTPSARALRDEELLTEILAAHKASRGTYGAPRIHRALRKRGRSVSRKRVARLMARRGLAGRARRRTKRTTISDPAAAKTADLLGRRFAPASHAPDAVWCGDITYVRTHEGWAYLATVIDLASRRVVGLAMADHLRASLATEALEMALTLRRPAPGLIFHSDRGCQYTSGELRELLTKHKIIQSLSRPAQCWDNAVAESFFATLKEELLYRGVWPTRSAAKRAIFEYVEVFYNRQRMHSSLDYLTPVDYEARRRNLGEEQAA
ncbi:MAG: IS3 family transposase [Methyloceanibacter sp.]